MCNLQELELLLLKLSLSFDANLDLFVNDLGRGILVHSQQGDNLVFSAVEHWQILETFVFFGLFMVSRDFSLDSLVTGFDLAKFLGEAYLEFLQLVDTCVVELLRLIPSIFGFFKLFKRVDVPKDADDVLYLIVSKFIFGLRYRTSSRHNNYIL